MCLRYCGWPTVRARLAQWDPSCSQLRCHILVDCDDGTYLGHSRRICNNPYLPRRGEATVVNFVIVIVITRLTMVVSKSLRHHKIVIIRGRILWQCFGEWKERIFCIWCCVVSTRKLSNLLSLCYYKRKFICFFFIIYS